MMRARFKISTKCRSCTDHPVGMTIYMDWQLYKAAESSGVRTVLSGVDGDSDRLHTDTTILDSSLIAAGICA